MLPPPPDRFVPIANAAQDQVVTDARFPGFSITLPAGTTITGWDGAPKTQIADEFRVIKRPLVTESVMADLEKTNTYVFEVHPDANKVQIRKAVAAIARLTGERPLGWMPRYGPSPNTRELLVAEGGSPSSAAHARERAVAIADQLARLRPDYRDVIVLRKGANDETSSSITQQQADELDRQA